MNTTPRRVVASVTIYLLIYCVNHLPACLPVGPCSSLSLCVCVCVCGRGVTVQGNKLTVDEQQVTEESAIYRAEWVTTGLTKSQKGERQTINVVLQVYQAPVVGVATGQAQLWRC